jgi:hypothetical protein
VIIIMNLCLHPSRSWRVGIICFPLIHLVIYEC